MMSFIRKIFIFCAVTIGLLYPSATYADTVTPQNVRISDSSINAAITTTNTVLNFGGNSLSGVTIQVTGTWTGSLLLQGSLDGATPLTINVNPLNSAVPQSSITSNGIYYASVGGYAKLSIVPTVASGTANVYVRSTAASNTLICTSGCIASVTGTSPIVVTNGTTAPNISISANPSFSSITDTGLITGNCLNSSGSNVVNSAGFSCAASLSTNFTVPSVGGTVSVTPNVPFTAFKYTPITINDGTNVITGYVNANVSSASSFIFFETSIVQGTAGNTVANGAEILAANDAAATSTTLTSSTSNLLVTGGPAYSINTASSPTYSGTVSAGTFKAGTAGIATSNAYTFGNATTGTNNTVLDSTSATVSTVTSNVARIANGATSVLAMDNNGNLGISGGLYSSNLYDSALTNGNCVNINSSKIFISTGYTCSSNILSSFTIPSVGTTVSVTPNVPFTALRYTPITITDGTNLITGYVNASVSASSTFVLFETSVIFGAINNSMASGAEIIPAIYTNVSNLASGTNVSTALTGGNYTINLINNPTFSGSVTSIGFTATGTSGLNLNGATQNYPNAVAYNDTNSGRQVTIGSNSTQIVATIAGTCMGMNEYGGVNLLSMDCSGNTGFKGSVYAAGGVVYSGNSGSYNSSGFQLGTGYSTYGTVSIGNAGGFPLLGVNGELIEVFSNGGTRYLTLDHSGNMAISGAYYSSTGTIQTSTRNSKNNIKKLNNNQTIDLINSINFVNYCYKVEHCSKNQEKHIGFIADDTSTIIAPGHKGEDVGGTAALGVYGVQIALQKIKFLENMVYFLAGFTVLLTSFVVCLGIKVLKN